MIRRELRRIGRFWRLFLSERRSWAVEIILALQAIMFGAWLMMPWRTFDTIPGVYEALNLLPEWFWGALFFAEGALHLRAIDRGNMARRELWTIILAGLWLIVLCAFLSTVPLSSATPMYAAPFVAAIWAHRAHSLNGDGGPQRRDDDS